MNRWKQWTWAATNDRLIARFGTGRLVRCAGSRYELQGGNDGDLAAAREWVAHFLHEAVIERPSPSQTPVFQAQQTTPMVSKRTMSRGDLLNANR
jgi:hypothetical protein